MAGRPPPRFVPTPFSWHQEIELGIDTLTNEGVGLGRVDGWVVMVPFALPGERVVARVWRNHKNYSEADLVSVPGPSPERVAPECPLFGTCGGCQYQHLAYPAQLAWKRRQVGELLVHLAGIEHPVEPVIASPRSYGYRSKITPHFDRPQKGVVGPIGFLRAGRRFEIVDVPRCPIAMEEINAALGGAREVARAAFTGRRKGATLLLRAHAGGVATDPAQPVLERVGGLEFEFFAGDFFQNNPFLLPRFVEHVVDRAAAPGIRHLVDAYCGSGLFALAASPRFESVAGVEISESAVARARRNAERNGIAHAQFIAGEAESVFAGIEFPPGRTAVIIDPPRRGSDAGFLGQLFAFSPQRVVYVSCNPATQMRDLRAFLAAGYALREVQPFDLFPQTKHLECVMVLERGA
jgi:tRNA/tmRNA/rRNA uracil-C5-methylase (TrmA/RlmC/RlmD family)